MKLFSSKLNNRSETTFIRYNLQIIKIKKIMQYSPEDNGSRPQVSPQRQNNPPVAGKFSQNESFMNQLIESIHQELLPTLKIESLDPHNPVVVHHVSTSWQLLGTGNYAAVFYHPNYPDLVVKIYAPGRLGWTEELEVYRRLGSHPAFSECFYAEEGLLLLKRLYGVTLYDCMHQGLKIPKQVIKDIDRALKYARGKGLYPHDVHGRNVMMSEERRGLVVDVSDFLHQEPCLAWEHLKKAYYWLYLPFFSWHRLRVPYFVLDIVRTSYRLFRRLIYRNS